MRATSSGVHLLSCQGVIDTLIRRSGVGPGDLVIDFGAGPGTLTAPLARTGSAVLAVERDDDFVRALRRRFATRPTVRVVHDDLRRVRLPRRDFAVVSSIPFAVSTVLLRRLLSPVPTRCALADLVVEHGLARRLTSRPRDLESAWWASRFDLRLVRRIPARCFTPSPSVDAAHLSVRRRSGLDGRSSAVLFAVLQAVHRRPGSVARLVLAELVGRRVALRVLVAAGVDPAVAGGAVRGSEWARVAQVLAGERGVVAPRLPRELRPRG